MVANGGVAGRLRHTLVDAPGSVGARMRARRWELLEHAFPDLSTMSVLDLGGTVEWWRRAPVRPKDVTVLNLFEPGESDDPSLLPVTGDACRAREALEAAGAQTSYDVVVSNSLLEHVGGHAQRCARSRRATGCRRPTATSRSSRTGSSPGCSSCRWPPARGWQPGGRWPTAVPTHPRTPCRRCSGPSWSGSPS